MRAMAGGAMSVTKLSICSRWPIRTGAGACEFRGVASQDHVAGIRDDRLGDADFAVVVIEKRSVRVDAGCADYRMVDVELTDEIDRGLADDPAV